MRFRTRAFALGFVPFAVLLAVSFTMTQRLVQSTVRDTLRSSLRENQIAMGRLHAKGDVQNSRFLKVAGDNAALKAGVQLMSTEASASARRTVEDQLLELGEHMGFDMLLVSAPDGRPLVGVLRQPSGAMRPMTTAQLAIVQHGITMIDGHSFQVGSVPLDNAQDNVGSLSVGEAVDLRGFASPAVLLHHGVVVQSNLTGVPVGALTPLQRCPTGAECEVKLHGDDWISVPMPGFEAAGDYELRTLENVDHTAAPVQSKLHILFLTTAVLCVLLTAVCSVFAARSTVKPIAALVEHLRKARNTGLLPEFSAEASPIQEIRELTESYSEAAASVREAREGLQNAYIEFVGSLASALDARDPYTAGHSHRVSDLSCAVASAMHLADEEVERIRIGALLHDIGKIGIGDALLQKPGHLTQEEFAAICEHPLIGRHILQQVQGFTPFLQAVECHHENWDGTGYPHRQSGEETPLEARIIHVADAFDAMTTDRAYRAGMSRDKALQILREKAGSQFDPKVVELFLQLFHRTPADSSNHRPSFQSTETFASPEFLVTA